MSTILVVDDAKLMRNIIKSAILEQGQHTVLEAKDGEEALALYKGHRPDLVTMDITMEQMDGLEAARLILEFDPAARIIMVTALGQEKMLRECIASGVRDYIVKPFSKERIASSVTRQLDPPKEKK
jgi:two-component system chemotaxis response regulator CheY